MIKLFYRDQNGIAATEFALMAPVLLFMLIGIVDYGTYLNSAMKLESTALSAAQYIRAGGLEDDLQEDVILESNLGLTAGNAGEVTVAVDYFYECADGVSADEDTDCGSGDYLRQFVEVTLTRDVETLIPYPGIDALELRGQVRLQSN